MGRQHELELATAELERAQERLMALEREKHALQAAADAAAAAAAQRAGAGDAGCVRVRSDVPASHKAAQPAGCPSQTAPRSPCPVPAASRSPCTHIHKHTRTHTCGLARHTGGPKEPVPGPSSIEEPLRQELHSQRELAARLRLEVRHAPRLAALCPARARPMHLFSQLAHDDSHYMPHIP